MAFDRNKHRSDSYQHLLLEISAESEILIKFSDSQSLSSCVNPLFKEEWLDLQEQLKAAFWRLSKELTERQQEVLKQTSKGKTQVEIAKILGVNQSSITKSIFGNIDYRNGKKVYGGAKKKILKLAEDDLELKQIFKRLGEISAEYEY